MAALRSRRRHHFLAGVFYLLSFFLAYSQRSQIWCLPYFHTWCALSANLECTSEMCCIGVLNFLLWPPYGIGQAIIFLSCGFFFYILLLIFFLAYSQPSHAYSQPSLIGCLPYLHTWCGLSANLGCRSETCCMRLAGNTGRKKSPKIRHPCTITQVCRAISSQLRHTLTIGKKIIKQQYFLHVSPLYGELRPTNGWDLLASLGHPC